MLVLSKKQTSKFSNKFKVWLNHAGCQGCFLRFYDLLHILSQKDYRERQSAKCVTRRVIHMAIHILVKVSDPLENPTNSQIEYYFCKKPNVYAGSNVVLNLWLSSASKPNQQNLYIHTVPINKFKGLIMFTTIKLNPRVRPNGHTWYQSSFAICAHMTDAQMVAHATKVLTEDRALDRSHLLEHLNNGNFVIERTPS